MTSTDLRLKMVFIFQLCILATYSIVSVFLWIGTLNYESKKKKKKANHDLSMSVRKRT